MLKENDLLKLIPQCQYRTTTTDFLEWYFYRSKIDNFEKGKAPNNERKLIERKIAEEDINYLIEKAKPFVAKLPKIK